MPEKRIVQRNANDSRRRDNGFVMSRARRAVLTLLCCAAILPGSAARGREPVVRQEAPFPTILDLSIASGASEPVFYEVLRGDFHMHTPHSDGAVSPTDRVVEAWQYGYDVMAITDHGTFAAYEEALPMAKALGVVLIRGMETGISGQEHFVALDFAADYEPRNSHRWAESRRQTQVFYQDQWQRLSAAGGYVIYAHPHVGLREPVLWSIGQGLLQGIEVKNDVVGSGWNTVASHGTYWYPFALDWAVENNLAIFANSDVHAARGDAEQAVTLVLATERSPEAVMEALRAGRTVAYFNNMLCSHEWVLDLLMASLVDVRLNETDEGKVFLCLHNRGPLTLTAQIADMPIEPVALGGYQKVLVGLRRKPELVAVTWKNLYLRPTENLTTAHALIGMVEQGQTTR